MGGAIETGSDLEVCFERRVEDDGGDDGDNQRVYHAGPRAKLHDEIDPGEDRGRTGPGDDEAEIGAAFGALPHGFVRTRDFAVQQATQELEDDGGFRRIEEAELDNAMGSAAAHRLAPEDDAAELALRGTKTLDHIGGEGEFMRFTILHDDSTAVGEGVEPAAACPILAHGQAEHQI